MTKNTSIKNNLDVLVFTRRKDYELHKTLLSLIEARKKFANTSIKIAVNSDEKSESLSTYLKDNDSFIKTHGIQVKEYTPKSLSLNLFTSSKTSSYTALVEAGDCVGSNTLKRTFERLSGEENKIAYAHTEVRFFKNKHKINKIHETADFPEDQNLAALISLEEQRFSNFLVFPTHAIENYEPPLPKPGFGQPRWHLVTSLIAEGFSLVRVPQTVVFTPEKAAFDDYLTLPYGSPLYKLPALRGRLTNEAEEITVNLSTKERIKELLKNSPRITKVAQKSLHYADIIRRSLPSVSGVRNSLNPTTDEWLLNEAGAVHLYNSSVFLSSDRKFHIPRTQDNLKQSLQVGTTLAKSADLLRNDTYDYVFMVPWLIAGGADMFFINYVNTIATLRPNKKVLLISTEPTRKSLTNEELKISDQVDFLRLAELVGKQKDSDDIILHSLALLIEIVNASAVHVGLSRLGYKYVRKYGNAIKSVGLKIILTGYNEIITEDNKREGYVHDAIPNIFNTADLITTDNKEIAALWKAEYGFSDEKVAVHHQPFHFPEINRSDPESFSSTNPVRVLWAAHVRKEKNPETFADIAKELSNDSSFSFTAYGALDRVHYRKSPFAGITNLTYNGSYRNFFRDINPDNYDVFVYTSLADGTPNILIEAGIGQLPVITSDVGGIGKLISEDGTLVKEPTDTTSYVKTLKDFRDNPSGLRTKATAYKKRLSETQTFESFNREVEAMLRKIDF